MDSTYSTKFTDDFYIIFFSGIDILGNQMVLFTSIMQKKNIQSISVMCDQYIEAGFRSPEHMIIDSLEFQKIIIEKLGLTDQ